MPLEQGLNCGFQQIPCDGSKLDMNLRFHQIELQEEFLCQTLLETYQ